MNTLTNNQKVLISALVGFIIGAAAVWVWSVSTTPQDTAMENAEESAETASEETEETMANAEGQSTSSETSEPNIAMDNSELVTVTDETAGSEVGVSVSFEAPGWVAIHEERNGQLGNVLGAKWFPAGDHEAAIKLLRSTVAGAAYHAVLYNDDGDRRFDVGSEARLLDGSKQPIQTSFIAE